MFGIDATTYPRPNAECSPGRGLHYAPCRCDGDRKVVPGWQFQWVMGLEWGSSSWTLPVDARQLPEGSCPVTATAAQIRDLASRLSRRQEPAGRPAPLFILDQGYAAAALTHALAGLRGPAAGAHRRRPRLLRRAAWPPQARPRPPRRARPAVRARRRRGPASVPTSC